jgi:spermidine/putrescine transport system ATP-binding protein
LSSPAAGTVELRNVRKVFGDVVAVDGVSLCVGAGVFFSLLGPSGCGKTTILRMIAGFETPTEGDVRLAGAHVANIPPHRRDVNTVFQQYALFPHMSVFENVAFGLRMKRLGRAAVARAVREMLALVRLDGYEERRPGQLSGGEQQRVALARALVNRPAILLLDEPLAALDLQLRRQMQTELKSLQRQVGITFLYVTHDQFEAMALSDELAVMRQGRVQQVGTPEDIYERPRNRFVANFIGSTNLLEGVVQRREPPLVRIAFPSGAAGLSGWATDETGCGVGQAVAVSLRPERITLSRPSNGVASDGNSLGGRVVDLTYLGTDIQYRVSLADGLSLTALARNGSADGRFAVGDPVRAEWSPAHMRTLAD